MRFLFISLMCLSLTISVQAQHNIPDSKLILQATFYTATEAEQLNANRMPMFSQGSKDSIRLGEYQIVLQSDETFNYRLVLRIISPDGSLGFLTIPVNNSSVGDIYDEVRKSLQINKEGSWQFQFGLKGEATSFQKSPLNTPCPDENREYSYRFTSTDQGLNWIITSQ